MMRERQQEKQGYKTTFRPVRQAAWLYLSLANDLHQVLHFAITNLEGFGEHSRLYRRHGGKRGTRHLRCARILAGECGDAHGSLITHIQLKVDEALGEEEEVALHDSLREELVLGGDKSHV
ncbi:hypothetical protein GOP47_0012028 [Adiantum capillus-veneris]|uniref:Uncharacterized protein n=1 Tax=Adiantum capillus-veneris TaxID=13818 RepID=A0A9D4UUK5_ADICA|nr:hypothetical protein GOP47_0012028 [Adiantum capillus-veneris]